MQAQLAESQKLDALGQLTGGVAHDFNNLLMIISGSLHTLKKGLDDDPRRQRALAAIEAATKRGAALTSQLLTFARRQSVNPEPIDVAERIDAVRDVLDTGVGGTVTLQFDIDRRRLAGHRRRHRTRDRAGQSCHQRARRDAGRRHHYGLGAITLRSATRPTPATTSPSRSQTPAVGIAPDVLSRIFDPFFTTKPIGKGTGLGLSQVHGFAHQAGGTVRVSSELGKGTTITILLPRNDVASWPSTKSMASRPAAAARCCWSKTIRMSPPSAPTCLNNSATPSAGSTNAEAALVEIERDGIDLVFSDIVMPGKMDGLGLARHLKAMRPGLPILLATGYSDAAAQRARRFSDSPQALRDPPAQPGDREIAALAACGGPGQCREPAPTRFPVVFLTDLLTASPPIGR